MRTFRTTPQDHNMFGAVGQFGHGGALVTAGDFYDPGVAKLTNRRARRAAKARAK